MRWLGVLMIVGLGACSSGTRPPQPHEQGYTGPPLRLSESGGEHLVVLTAPTAGWSFSLDEIRLRMGRKDVYVTVRRPNPAYLHAQAEVTQNLGTQVSVKEPIEVYARVLDYNERGGLNYFFAAESK